jgi:hypothetical protein
MAKGLFGGMTDYSHQSFVDIQEDLDKELRNITGFIQMIESNLKIVEANGYWKKVPSNFKSQIHYALKHYNTTKQELKEISKEIKFEVKAHHCKRLERIASVASQINIDLGRIWHQQYDNKEYGNVDFDKVERIYGDTRDMSVNLKDLSNISERFTDYVGKSKHIMKNNPWISGSFYLLTVVLVLTTLAVISNFVVWHVLPIVLIAGILLVGIIGALQLRNDDMLKEENFVKLMIETYKRLPLLKSGKSK